MRFRRRWRKGRVGRAHHLVPMSQYLRFFQPGGTFFFTVVTHGRWPLFRHSNAIRFLGDVMRGVQEDSPFEMTAFVILPDHLHCMWTLPMGDFDFSSRWSRIKRKFTQAWLRHVGAGKELVGTAQSTNPTKVGMAHPTLSASRVKHREKDVWQRRFWEHTIRDETDFRRHLDYIHFNPVKHGLVDCPHAWEHSSFLRWVKERFYAKDWQCVCRNRDANRPDFDKIAATAME